MGDKKGFLIYVEPGIHKKMKILAAEKGISMSDYIRRLIIRELNKEKEVD